TSIQNALNAAGVYGASAVAVSSASAFVFNVTFSGAAVAGKNIGQMTAADNSLTPAGQTITTTTTTDGNAINALLIVGSGITVDNTNGVTISSGLIVANGSNHAINNGNLTLGATPAIVYSATMPANTAAN